MKGCETCEREGHRPHASKAPRNEMCPAARERKLAGFARYRQDHHEEIRAREARYYKEHVEEKRARQIQYRKEHPEETRAANARYRKEHQEELRMKKVRQRFTVAGVLLETRRNAERRGQI